MQLQELYKIFTDSVTVVVNDSTQAEIARYDGRNSIPVELNTKEIALPIIIDWEARQIIIEIID